jgi:hypothetical protein
MTPDEIKKRISMIKANRPLPHYSKEERIRCKKDAAARIHELTRELRTSQGLPAYLPRGMQGKSKAKPSGDSPA